MLSCTSFNKFTRGKSQRVPGNLDNPKNGQTLEQAEHWVTYPIVGASEEAIRRLNTPGKSISVNFYLNHLKKCELP